MRSVSSFTIFDARAKTRKLFNPILLSILSAAILTVAAIAPAMAAPPVENTQCILGQPGNAGVNCNSNDVTLSSPVVTVLDGCDYPGDFATLQVLVDVTNNAQTRYDIGVWLSVDGDPNGDGSASGTCSVLSIDPTVLDTNGVPADYDGDQCGDVESTGNAVDISQTDLGTVSLLCDDSDGDGYINVPVITSWKQNSSGVCTVSNEAWPGTSPKCTDNRDLALPVPVPGRIIVNKDTIPDDPQSFAFNLSGPDTGIPGGFNGSYDFSLTDDGITPANASFDSGDGTFEGGLLAGAYSVAETVPAGWLQSSAVCASDVDGLNTDPAAIDLRPGETVTCDFTNVLAIGDLTVRKQSVGGTDSFSFNVTGAGFDETNALDTGVSNPADWTQSVSIGTYNVAETIPAGWVLTSANCSGNNTQGAPPVVDLDAGTITGIVVAPGEDVVCTFVDAALGSVSVTKTARGGDAMFSFSHNINGGDVFDITTTDGSGSSSGITGVAAGTYQVTETVVPAGWQYVSAICTDQDANVVSTPIDNGAEFTQAVGQTTSCEFIDVKLGTIVYEKVTDPSPNEGDSFDFEGDFGFSLSDGGTLTISDVPVNPDGSTRTPYTVSEVDPTPAFDLTGLVCETTFNGEPLLVEPSVVDVPSRTATININAGETATCTFTNTERASITVEKVLSGTYDGMTTSFDFTSDFDAPFSLDPVNTVSEMSFGGLMPGVAHMVSETNPNAQGWALIDATCGDIGESVNLATGMITGIVPTAGQDITCTFTNAPLGSATIVKNSVGGTDVFSFTGSLEPFYGGGAGFTIDTSVENTLDFTNMLLPNLEYDVQEVVPAGWTLSDLICVDATGDSIPDGTEEPEYDPLLGALINATTDETVTCTFTNLADAQLTIAKTTIPASADVFAFTGTGALTGDLTNGNSLTEMDPPGTFVADETVTPGWALTDISCSGVSSEAITIGGTGAFVPGDTDVSVDLSAGQSALCTYTNTKLGSITIRKSTVGDTGAFTFTGSGTGITSPFNLATDGSDPTFVTFSGLLPGTYLFSETVPVGWEIDGTNGDIVCTGDSGTTVTPGSNSLQIDLLNGEDLDCTFTNTRQATIVVEKLTDPDTSTQAFTFTGDAAGAIGHGEMITVPNLTPGQYLSTETPVAGWDLSDITCDDANSSGDTGTGIATFNAEAGETVKCTFTNVIQRGNIVVVKNTAPVDSPQLFDFTLTGTGVDAQFQLADATTPFDSGDLLPSSENGPYSVAEGALPADWTLDSATCTGDNTPDSIDLAPGETVTCTFVNVQDGQSTFTKVSVGGDDQFFFTSSTPGGNFSLTTVDGSVTGPGESLPAGSYTITEDALAGWVLTGISCTESDVQDSTWDVPTRTITLNVQEGETLSCTVTNTKNGSITIAKATVPAGAPDSFDFTGDVAGSLTDGQSTSTLDVVPGAYTSTESLATGWDLTSIVCDDGVSTTPSTGDVETRTATFNVDPGEDVTCTFTNTVQYASIHVDKVTLPAALPQMFDFTLAGGIDTDQAFAMGDLTALYMSGDLLPTSLSGTYSVVEAAVDGWDNTGIVCTGSEGVEDPAAIDLDKGETVTCVFTNTQRGTVELALELNGPIGDTFEFEGVLPQVLGDGAVVSKEVSPGTYEGRLPRTRLITPSWFWLVESLTCNDGDSFVNLEDLVDIIATYVVAPGETVRCTLVLRIPYNPDPVPVNNPLALLLMTLMMLAAGWYFRPAVMRK